MPLALGSRLHAFTHGIWRRSDRSEVRALYTRLRALLAAQHLLEPFARHHFANLLTVSVLRASNRSPDDPQAEALSELIETILAYEHLFELPAIDWTKRRTIAEWWSLRALVQEQISLAEQGGDLLRLIEETFVNALSPVLAALPEESGDEYDLTIQTDLVHVLGDAGALTDQLLASFFDDVVTEAGLFIRLRRQLHRNMIVQSGGNPDHPSGFSRAVKLPSRSGIAGNDTLLTRYLADTPLLPFFDQSVAFRLPTAVRFEHQHIIAGSGHGKTQTLQHFIANDLPAVSAGRRSIVVIDSQGDLINTIANLSVFAPGQPLSDRVVIIDPTDVTYPVSLNLFDVGTARLEQYEALERERLTNSILELYDFVLGSLLEAEMTQKQSVIFRYVTRLMLRIPDATIHTLRELLEPTGAEQFADSIESLEGIAREFFRTEFSSREFEQTKKQVLRRLWGILENQTFERMFSHPRSKLDLFSEMNAGKVILIHTAKDLLKEQGSEIFGRFFIAMITQAAQERATLREHERMPTFVYIDEAADYFDENISIILSQARKYKVSMALAHQYLGQLEPKLQDAFSANTAIKFAGGVSAKDARALAPMLSCTPAFIESQQKGSFAASVRGHTKQAVPLRFPFGTLESRSRMSPRERERLQATMRTRYANHYSELAAYREPTRPPIQEARPAQHHPAPNEQNRRTRRRNRPNQSDSSTDAGFELQRTVTRPDRATTTAQSHGNGQADHTQ